MKTQYAKIAEGYHQHMLNNAASVKDDFVDICDLGEKSIKILEYGCGSGIDASYFLNKYPNVSEYVGVDNSNEMLEKFKATVENSKVELVLSDLDTYIPEENHFDLVFGMYSVHYTRNIEALMQKTYDSLKSGGFFCFRDAHPIVGFFKKKSKKYDVKEDVEFPLAGGGSGITVKHPTFTFQEYVNAASSAGFRIITLNENIGKQSNELGVAGYEIPTTFTMILKKD